MSPGSSRAPDGRSLSTKDDSCLSQPAKDVRTGCSDTPSDGFVSHCSDDQSALLFPESDRLPPSSHEGPFIVSEALSPFNGGKTFLACHDGTETVAESSSLCRRLSEIVGADLSSLLSFRSAGGGTWAMTGCLG